MVTRPFGRTSTLIVVGSHRKIGTLSPRTLPSTMASSSRPTWGEVKRRHIVNAEQRPTGAFETAQTLRAGLRRAMGDAEGALAAPASGRPAAWAARVGTALRTLQG